MVLRSELENRASSPVFVSYIFNCELLAEVLAANNINGVQFKNTDSVKAVVDGNNIIMFFGGNTELSVPQALIKVWVEGEGVSGLIQFKELAESSLAADLSPKAPVKGYRLETVFDGSEVARVNVIHELFTRTDIAKLSPCRRVNVYKGGAYETLLGSFTSGGERIVTDDGKLSGYTADACGGTVIDYDDGALTISDCGDADWNDRSIQAAISFLGDRSHSAGVNKIEKISCERLFLLDVPTQVEEISANAFADCPKLRTVTVNRRDTKLGEGFVPASVLLKGLKGSTAEAYANAHNMQFEADNFAGVGEKLITLAEGLSLTVGENVQQADGKLFDIDYAKGESFGYLTAEVVNCGSDSEKLSAEKAKLAAIGAGENVQQLSADPELKATGSCINAVANRLNSNFDMYAFVLEFAYNNNAVLLYAVKSFAKGDSAGPQAAYERILQLGRSAELDEEAAPVQIDQIAVQMDTAPEVIQTEETVTDEVQPAVEEFVEEIQPAVEEVVEEVQPVVEEAAAEDVQPAAPAMPVKKLVMGERFSLDSCTGGTLEVEFSYDAPEGLDIDGYFFLLKKDGKVRSDADLIFFGQGASTDGSVKIDPTNSRHYYVELDKVDSAVEKISVCYAIYGEDAAQTFANVKNAVVRFSFNGHSVCEFELAGLDIERSAVAAEFYRKGSWKVRAVSRGYKGALKSLCENYGVEVQ